MSSIKNIAVVGGTGDLGRYLVRSLASSTNFAVLVLTRGNKNVDLPASIKTAVVDYERTETIVEALKGQDAVVSVVPGDQSKLQLKIIDAAILAGVHRFIPSEFGSNNRNPIVRQMPLMVHKVAVDEKLKSLADDHKLTYTAIVGGPFIEWMLKVEGMMPIKDRKFFIHDGGDIPFSMTKMEAYGDAIVGVLIHAKETENRTVFIESVRTTQNEVLRIAKEIFPGDWTVEHVDTEGRYLTAERKIHAGVYDMSVISGMVFKIVFGPGCGGAIEGVDNDLVGVKKVTDVELRAIIEALG